MITQLQRNKNDWPLLPCLPLSVCTLWNVTSIADRRGALEWIYCLNTVPCVCVLPLFPDLFYWWICMARSVPQQQFVCRALGQRRILKSDQSPAVSVQAHHTLYLVGLAGNIGRKRKYITCWRIRLPTSWWHMESHCCCYIVTIFQLDDTCCWSGSVYCMWACGRMMANCLLWEEQTRAEMLHCEDGPASFDALAKRA